MQFKMLFLTFALSLASVLIQLWLLKKIWRLLFVLFLATIIGGCASSSNKFDKSPCACKFENINTGNFGSDDHA